MKRLSLIIFAIITLVHALHAQQRMLKAGFDKQEYIKCLRMASNFKENTLDTAYLITPPTTFDKKYSSANIGFDNGWELWTSADSVVAISIRGSITTELSWMSNFNAGSIATKGTANIGEPTEYNICNDNNATVHAGWCYGMLYLAKEILPKLDSCYKQGYRNYIITGHSQGGAIAFLLTSHLYYLQSQNVIPNDITFKTYCSAAPKPGNMAFAYHFDYITRGGWAFNVVNAADWVPETPLSVQTIDDFAPTNPFTHVDELIGQLTFPQNAKVRFLFHQLDQPTRKSERHLRKYLGETLGKMVQEKRPGYVQPTYRHCANYMRAGTPIVLMPDENYYKIYPRAYDKDPFIHHIFRAYLFLAERY